MSRLYDRVVAEGCRPMTVRDILTSGTLDESWQRMIAQVLEEEGRGVSEEAVNERLALVYADARETVSAAR